jgi:hypothetical protein
MSGAMNLPGTCGCGSLDRPMTPVSLVNRPGLSALAYRVGTHGRFKQTLLQAIALRPELSRLTTRYDEDPTIALLDGWAAVLDVLAFYQERIANEGFLRTAVERRSVLELARTIGYELGPGVAAGTYLAFTLEKPLVPASLAIASSTPTEITLPIGTRVQSIPGQDELPQIFETVEPMVLRADWNELKVRSGRAWTPSAGSTDLYLQGTGTQLKPGDFILITTGDRVEGERPGASWAVRRLHSVTPDPERGMTRVTWDERLGSRRAADVALPHVARVQVHAFRARAAIFGHNAQDWPALSDVLKADYLGIPEESLSSADRVQWPAFKIYSPVYPPRSVASPDAPGPPGDIPGTIILPGASRRPDPVLTDDSIDLDTTYSGIVAGGWMALMTPDRIEVFEVAAISETSRAQFLLSGKVTRLKLGGGRLAVTRLEAFKDAVRETVVLAQSESMVIGQAPITRDVRGRTVHLDRVVAGLTPGRAIAISGTNAITGELTGEIVILDRAEVSGGVTRLVFTSALRHAYRRDAVLNLNANVARATHGETRTEILGTGDGGQPFQSFTLKHSPLTYVAAANARGAQSTLAVRVDGVLWSEVPSLYNQAPGARVYITRRSDDGTVRIQFGDGITGARLSTGQEVTAVYRAGIGLGGLVRDGQLSLLMSRPLGLKEVVNPAAATGAADPEDLAMARDNAPLTVLTLDRIVSLQDHEDFARAFAGIAKARATLLWNGEQRLVHLSVAGVGGAAVDENSDLYRNLRDAIDLARHFDQIVLIGTYAPLSFDLTARLRVHPDHQATQVIAAVSGVLKSAFSFQARAFAQGVTSSELIASMQAVPGVEGVILDQLYFTGDSPGSPPHLAAAEARWDSTRSTVLPAELLTLRPEGIKLTELTGVLPE